MGEQYEDMDSVALAPEGLLERGVGLYHNRRYVSAHLSDCYTSKIPTFMTAPSVLEER